MGGIQVGLPLGNSSHLLRKATYLNFTDYSMINCRSKHRIVLGSFKDTSFIAESLVDPRGTGRGEAKIARISLVMWAGRSRRNRWYSVSDTGIGACAHMAT
jgi:hypothetical protein